MGGLFSLILRDGTLKSWRHCESALRSGTLQPHDKLRALVRLAVDFDGAAVSFDDGFDQAQTEAEAALGSAFVAAVEPGPDFILLFGRNSYATVAEGNRGCAVLRS